MATAYQSAPAARTDCAAVRCRVDVHHHFVPAAYVAAVGEEKLAAATAAGRLSGWSVEQSLELMDLGEIETSIASTPSPNYPIGDLEETHKLCRSCNELTAQVVRDHPGRFGMFASLLLLPAMNMETALREIEYCLDVLAADGVALRTNYLGRHLGDPLYDPLWQELDRRGCVVHVHPAVPPGSGGIPGISASTLEYPFDTTRTIVSLLYNDTPQRFPRVSFIFSHAGGAIPYLAGRVAAFSEVNPRFKQRGLKGAIAALKGFYYDVTDSVSPCTFKALLELVPVERLLFGSDIPFADEQRVRLSVSGLAALGLEQHQLQGIDRDNAARLFPRLRDARWEPIVKESGARMA